MPPALVYFDTLDLLSYFDVSFIFLQSKIWESEGKNQIKNSVLQ